MQAALDNPAQYDDRLVRLAQDIYEKRRTLNELTHEERQILNLGAFEFAQYRPPPKTKAPASPPRPKPTPPDGPEPSGLGEELPFELHPFWWT